jgi:hypothetical protein
MFAADHRRSISFTACFMPPGGDLGRDLIEKIADDRILDDLSR